MNEGIGALFDQAHEEGFKVYQLGQVAYGQSWRCSLQYLSAKHEIELSCAGTGNTAKAALAAALEEGRELFAKHGKRRPDQPSASKTARDIEGLLE